MKQPSKKKIITATLLSVLATSSLSALAAQGDWLVRFGAVNVSPDDSSTGLTGVGPTATVGVDGNTQAFVNLSYMIRDNVAVELLAATPFKHDINGTGALSALGKVGETKQLPPTVSLQYHFNHTQNVRPYVGAGINYTTFFQEKATNAITSLKLDDSFGFAVQAGVDIDITKDWFFNADIRYISIETTATTDLGTTEVEINPTVISLGVGTRF
jgi:outer membrane protein